MRILSGRRARIRRGPLPLRWRVAVAFALVSMVVAVAFALVTYKLAASYMLDQREESALRQAEVNQRLVGDTLRSQPSGNLGELLKGLSGNPETTVALWTDGAWVIQGRHIDTASLPAGIHRLVGSHAAGQERATIEGIPVLAVALPIENTSSMYVELFPVLELEQTIGFLRAVLVSGVAISTVLGFALGHWASRRALRPLTELTKAAARVARGDLHARLPEHADADLAELAASFNRTAGDLERRVRQDARFAADVSHELRSPLTTMLNAVAVLRRRRDELSPAGRHALDLLGADVQRFHRMVVDLLEISRGDHDPDNRELETCNLAELVRHAMSGHAAAALHIDDPAPVVLADRRRLDRVVANLLDNAQHHGGGVVRVAVRHASGHARLEVDDAGPGVPAELRQQIFERFTRGHRAGDRDGDTGSGLGLALVAQHVYRHGGSTWVEDRPGGGARFVVELPDPQRPGASGHSIVS